MRVMNINRTCKSTKAGGLTRYSALVMCGNRKGLVGYALSKVCSPSHSALLCSSSLTFAFTIP
jgi:ribosomal protein S5